MHRRLLAVGMVLLGSLACVSPAGAARASASRVVAPTRVGSLRLERSTRQEVRDRFGPPELGDHAWAGYDCVRRGCLTNFFFAKHGRLRNRLVGAVLTSAGRGFHTRSGTEIGMRATEARRREPKALAGRTCGIRTLRYPSAQGVAGVFGGLTIFLYHGHVRSFVVMSPLEPVSCLPGGAFEPGSTS